MIAATYITRGQLGKPHSGQLNASSVRADEKFKICQTLLAPIVPNRNSVRPASDAIPRGEAKSVSRSRPRLSLANEIRRCTRVQVSTVRTLISKRGRTEEYCSHRRVSSRLPVTLQETTYRRYECVVVDRVPHPCGVCRPIRLGTVPTSARHNRAGKSSSAVSHSNGSGGLNGPRGVAFGPSGNLFVTSQTSN